MVHLYSGRSFSCKWFSDYKLFWELNFFYIVLFKLNKQLNYICFNTHHMGVLSRSLFLVRLVNLFEVYAVYLLSTMLFTILLLAGCIVVTGFGTGI